MVGKEGQIEVGGVETRAGSAEPNAGSDQKLMSLVKAGDRHALAALYDRHAPQMLGLAFRILQNRGDAEDLVHDVFLEAWHKADHYDAQRSTVRTWLVLRMRSRAIDRLRSLTKVREQVGFTDESQLEPEGERPNHISDRVIAQRALESLSEEQRTVIELSYFEGLTCREIAVRCEIPVGTVKSRLSAAIQKLRQQLKPVREQAYAER
jgi:RNA polymerase sigma-70 factor (ECF subfamily)